MTATPLTKTFCRVHVKNSRKCHIIEKGAIAIVEAVRKWGHYLTCQHFTQITDQRSVVFMFSNEKHTKI